MQTNKDTITSVAQDTKQGIPHVLPEWQWPESM